MNKEQQDLEDSLRDARKKEQDKNKDYSYYKNGSIEQCDDCGCYINSRGHCPMCDY